MKPQKREKIYSKMGLKYWAAREEKLQDDDDKNSTTTKSSLFYTGKKDKQARIGKTYEFVLVIGL